jgi:hypothetical protein
MTRRFAALPPDVAGLFAALPLDVRKASGLPEYGLTFLGLGPNS